MTSRPPKRIKARPSASTRTRSATGRRAKPGVVWERAEPAARAQVGVLSRDGIVRAAIAIADSDGIEAVSLRNVGAALDAGPMRLYGYLSTKEELLELMIDAVFGEMKAPIRGHWRAALKSIAQRLRRTAGKHPWFVDLLSGRSHLGPHALAYFEASLAAIAKTVGTIDAAVAAVGTVNAYVVGALRIEASDANMERQSGMTEAEWQRATGPYMERMIATGRFPTLERVVREATHPSPEVVFAEGLDCVLDGIAARL